MTIGAYSIGGYLCLLMVIILMAIDGYYIGVIGEYYISGYWWLFVVILLMILGGYSIDDY